MVLSESTQQLWRPRSVVMYRHHRPAFSLVCWHTGISCAGNHRYNKYIDSYWPLERTSTASPYCVGQISHTSHKRELRKRPVSCAAWGCTNRHTIKNRPRGIIFHKQDWKFCFWLYLVM